MIKVKNRKGITLITLVVTIIILIILAGVSLNILLGENGIIKKSKEAQELQNIARISEKLELLKGPILIEKQSVNLESYLAKLNDLVEEYDINNINKIDEANAYIIVEGKYKFLIEDEKNGNVIITYEGLGKPLVLSDLKVGDYVKYTPTAKEYTVEKAISGTSSDQSFNTNTYTGLWRVLYNDSTNGLQLISDSSVINLEFNGKTGYNNLVGTLNSVAGNYVNETYADSARSVGSTPSSTASTADTTSIYTNSTYAFIANSANDLKIADTNYTSDQAALESKDMLNITGDYWMASRYIHIDENGAGFQGALVGTFNDYTGLASILLKCVHADGSGQDHAYTAGVRPVVKLKSTLKINSGDGTTSAPWTLKN